MTGAFAERLDDAQEPVMTGTGFHLYPPFVVVCHDTRYKENNMVGLTRSLGIGKFGEFATFTLETFNKALASELKRKQQSFADEDIFAIHGRIRILGILRVYSPTNPGKRSQRYALHIVSPVKDVGMDLRRVERDARKRYQLRSG